jgi:signal transduction histidine kinase
MINLFTIASGIHFLTALAAVLTIVLLWRFRSRTEAKYMIYVQIFVAVWAVAYGLEFSSTALEAKVFWSKLSYFGIAFLPVSYFLFTTAFSQKKNVISKRNILLLLVIPVITLGLILTNDYHWLVWSAVSLDPVLNLAYYTHGVWFWVFFGFTQLLMFSGLYNLYRSIFSLADYYRSQITTLIIATVFPLIGNFIYISNLNPYPGFDWTPVSFVVSGLGIALGVVRYRMFDIVPVAKERLFDVVSDGVIVINAEGYIEDCNQAAHQIFNWQNKSVTHQPLVEVFKDFDNLITGIEAKKESIQIEVKNESLMNHYQIRISPIYRNGNFSGNILLFHDITAIITAEEELKQKNTQLLIEIDKREKLIEDLDAFAHTIAHDLRNSLSSIFSASEIMEDMIGENDKDMLIELSSLINQSANKSIQITHDLLMLATTDKSKVQLTPLNMKVIFADACKQLGELINTSEAKITTPEFWPDAMGYAPWIEEVWTNYLSNALKYGGTPPEIVVGSTMLNNGNIEFWIRDNGEGLSQEEQKRLFKKFVRLHPLKADGYGLGLTIVKKIVEKLGGNVTVESRTNGQGSKFGFTLPEAHNEAAVAFRKLHENSGFAVN